jgi:cation ABC transporter, periplasmic-binding protein
MKTYTYINKVIKMLAGYGLLSIILLCLTNCNGSKKNTFDPNKPTVTVTIEPYRYFVNQIAGDDVNVNVMVPAGSSPETYEPSAKQMMELSHSVIYFKVGEIGFEKTWMEKLHKNAPKMKIVDTSERIESAKTKSGYVDPHTWMSVDNAKIISYTIRDELSMMYPDKAKKFYERCEAFNKHLVELRDMLNAIYLGVRLRGNRQSSFVIYHPVLTYFAREYDLEQFALEDEGREPSIQQIQNIINLAKSEEISVLFVQKEFANRNIQTFINATNVKPIEINPLSYDWEEQMLLIMRSLTKDTVSDKAVLKAKARRKAANIQQ